MRGCTAVERQNRTLKTLTNISREFSFHSGFDELLGKIATHARADQLRAFSILLVTLRPGR